jgi:hypothetical protein
MLSRKRLTEPAVEESMPRWFRLVLAVLMGLPAAARAAPPAPAVAATVETTLATSPGQIRQFAFDGNPETYFASAGDAGRADHFTLVFDAPVAVKSIAVVTGRPGGSDALDAGTLEVSADGTQFEVLARFAERVALGVPAGTPAKAVRLRPAADLKHPLAVREVTIESSPAVAVFRYPIEVKVDVSQAPDLKDWAEKVARLCERQYPMICEELMSDGFTPRRQITLAMTRYNGVAFAGGGRIEGSARYFKDRPDDVGAMVHETVHCVQDYRRARNPGWLVEGIADYVRFFRYETQRARPAREASTIGLLGAPGSDGGLLTLANLASAPVWGRPRPLRPNLARYDGSYRVTAAFLAFVTDRYDRDLVRKVNAAMRAGTYSDAVFQQLTKKTLKELEAEWRASLGG